MLAQRRLHVLRLVVDRGVEAELAHDVVALLAAAGDADGATAFDLRDLPDHHADRAGRAGDDDRLARLRLADVEQAEVRRHARHAERAEIHRQRRDARIDFRQRPCRRQSRIPGCRPCRRRGRLAVNPGCRDSSTSPTPPARITSPICTGGMYDLHVVHPAAHRRIEREVSDLDQHLAFVRRAHGLFGVVPVGALRQADGTGCKAELMIECAHGGAPLFCVLAAARAYGSTDRTATNRCAAASLQRTSGTRDRASRRRAATRDTRPASRSPTAAAPAGSRR